MALHFSSTGPNVRLIATGGASANKTILQVSVIVSNAFYSLSFESNYGKYVLLQALCCKLLQNICTKG